VGRVEHTGLWHGAAFRLVETYDVDVASDWSVRLARQPYGELVVIRSGTCRVRLGEQEVLVGPGEAFALGRGEPRLTAAEGGRLALFGFGYRLETVPGGDLSGVLGAPLAIAPAPRRLRLLVERAVRQGESSAPADSLRARASAELAVAELLARSSGLTAHPPSPFDRRRELVLLAIGELEARYAEHLDLAAMAALVHVSPQHLAKVFRSVLQVTPTAYLKALRLSKARSLIALTDEPLTAIAYRCGFSDPAHFSRAFSQRYGESPTAARRRGAAFAESDAAAPASARGTHRTLTTID
jgi:AraC-like DNA-binding protein